MSTLLLCCSAGSLKHGFGVVLEAATRAARGFLQPCHAISEKAREIAIEGENVLKILSPGLKRRYRFLFGEGPLVLLWCSWTHFVLLYERGKAKCVLNSGSLCIVDTAIG